MKQPLKVAAAVALAGGLAMFISFVLVRGVLLDSFRQGLTIDVSTRSRIVQEKLEAAVLIAQAAASFSEATGRFDRQAFLLFTSRFLDGQSGLTAISYVAVVPAAERARFELEARELSGKADYSLYEGIPGAARLPLGERDIHYPVLFTTTRDPSAVVVMGYDLGSSSIRLAALERSRDSGGAAVTERITLVGDAPRPGFIIFHPVYDPRKPLATPAERRAAVRGFVQAIFSVDELIGVALAGSAPQGLSFELQDVSAPEANRSVFHWHPRLPPVRTWRSILIPEGIHLADRFSFAGRDWAIDVEPNAAYLEQRYPVAHWTILPIGLLMTSVSAAYLYAVLSRREEQARLIAQLRQAQDEIRTLEGILPICASCKKIRDETSDWVHVEEYVSRHTSAEFSHGICPECMAKLYPEIAERAARRAAQAV